MNNILMAFGKYLIKTPTDVVYHKASSTLGPIYFIIYTTIHPVQHVLFYIFNCVQIISINIYYIIYTTCIQVRSGYNIHKKIFNKDKNDDTISSYKYQITFNSLAR